MTALFDGGNSKLHFARWEDGSVRGAVDVPYPDSPGELPGLIDRLLDGMSFTRAAACSVSPRWGDVLFDALESRFPGTLTCVRCAADEGVTVAYGCPESYGVDRALAAAAAWRIFRGACVVVDAGTAVTVDAVDDRGVVRGGFIFPGADLLARGLEANTGLPFVTLSGGARGIGADTRSCIANGILLGMEGAVRELVRRAAEEVKSYNRVIVTGGGGFSLVRALGPAARHRPGLVFEGLGHVADGAASSA
jgi:type III pantothenate kinase